MDAFLQNYPNDMNITLRAMGLAIIAMLYSNCTSKNIEKDIQLPNYDIELSMDLDSHELRSSATIQLPESHLQVDTLVISLATPDSMIYSVTASDTKASIQKSSDEYGTEIKIVKSEEMKSLDLYIEYELSIPVDHEINRLTDEWIELNLDSYWFPVLPDYPDFTYTTSVNLDKDYEVITGDFIQPTSTGCIINNRIPRFDIAFCAAKSIFKSTGEYVNVYSSNAVVPRDSIAILADQAIEFLKEYIDNPKDFEFKRDVVVSPRKDVGYARKNYIVLSNIEKINPHSLSAFLAHEFSHYWFSKASPSSPDYWLTESFAEYMSDIYMRETYGHDIYTKRLESKRKRIQNDPKKLSEYTERPTYLALYKRGPLVLHEFEKHIGKESFKRLMNAFIDKDVKTTKELLTLIETVIDKPAAEKLTHLLATI